MIKLVDLTETEMYIDAASVYHVKQEIAGDDKVWLVLLRGGEQYRVTHETANHIVACIGLARPEEDWTGAEGDE